MQLIDRSFAAALRKYIKAMAEPEWKKGMARRDSTKMETRLSATSTIAVSSSNIRMQTGAKGRPFSGGLPMSQAAPAVEFRSNKYKQFGGTRRAYGPFFRTAFDMTPRLASLFTQTIIKTMALALNGKDPN
jgi:hypothetical protein